MAESFTIRGDTNPGPSLEEEAAAMDAKAAEVKDHGGLPSDNPEGSDLIAGKFKTQEDLVKAYKELEKKLHSKPSDANTADTTEAPQTDAEAEKAVEQAGLDMQSLSDEYADKGELSEASYEKLSKVGFPREVVDEYIAGKQALLQLAENAVYEVAGGKDQYGEMISWAADNLTSDEIDAYNEAVNSGNKSKIMLAVKGLKAQYAGTDREPTRMVSGKGAGSSAYRSVAELTKDMADPRYGKDAAFRKDVEDKLSRSNIF